MGIYHFGNYLGRRYIHLGLFGETMITKLAEDVGDAKLPRDATSPLVRNRRALKK